MPKKYVPGSEAEDSPEVIPLEPEDSPESAEWVDGADILKEMDARRRTLEDLEDEMDRIKRESPPPPPSPNPFYEDSEVGEGFDNWDKLLLGFVMVAATLWFLFGPGPMQNW